MILDILNGPDNAFHLDSKLPVSTACLCKLDKIYAKDPEVFPIWPEWKRDSLALSSVCKGLRALVFDAFWLRKAVMDWKPENLVKTRSALSTASCEKVRCVESRVVSSRIHADSPLCAGFSFFAETATTPVNDLSYKTLRNCFRIYEKFNLSACTPLFPSTKRPEHPRVLPLAKALNLRKGTPCLRLRLRLTSTRPRHPSRSRSIAPSNRTSPSTNPTWQTS